MKPRPAVYASNRRFVGIAARSVTLLSQSRFSLAPEDSCGFSHVLLLSLASLAIAYYLTREVYRYGRLSARFSAIWPGLRLVHSLFKEYHSCARSFSLLLLPAPLSLCRPARRKRLKKPPPKPLKPLRTLLPSPPTLLRTPLLPPPTLLPLLRPLPPTPLRPLRTPLPLLRTLPRRCNLRRKAQDWGAKGFPFAPFSFAARPC